MDFKERKKVAREIAKELKERNYTLVAKLIEIAGMDFTRNILEQTRKIQAEGGMMTLDKKRKRTAGGVFFRLANQQLPEETRNKVFPPKEWKDFRAKKKRKKQAANKHLEIPAPEPSEPVDKLAQLEEAAQTLRNRIAEMEAKGQRGVKMTKTLLANTEKQIEKLRTA